ncbi:MAG: DmsC/YnfH family molybdoenzyme membrane anchor subunit [Vicinamibacterales bacterium]
MSLPLLERAIRDDAGLVRLSKAAPSQVKRRVIPDPPVQASRPLMPARGPAEGEQYRFHMDMGACIGCKCCVVACNEQNANPASINWRRVSEMEGGFYPLAHRSYLSMGCNHCLEPTCLSGCPVDAYSKDGPTGIVQHSADACIGCQYCTWNCSYGVPQYNPERGVVGKCDMCQGRLSLGQAPACVTACPEGAIAIEIVKTSDWRAAVEAVATLGMPSGDGSLSTTRVTMDPSHPPDARPLDWTHVAPADPHWPLVVMTVLTQISVGGFAAIWLLQLLGVSTRLGLAAFGSLAVATLALGASTLHLGRPLYAYRAVKAWRRSWLSREVLAFAVFSAVAAAYAAALWFGWPGSRWLGGVTFATGCAGVWASACIYRVPSRPSWDTPFTVIQFAATAALAGPLFAGLIAPGAATGLALGAASTTGLALTLVALRVLRVMASERVALRGTARLLSTTFRSHLVTRAALLVLGGVILPLLAADAAGAISADGAATTLVVGLPLTDVLMAAALLVTGGAELLGRYLFFVSAVPTHMAAPYLALGSEAA